MDSLRESLRRIAATSPSWLRWLAAGSAVGLMAAAVGFFALRTYLQADLPAVDSLRQLQLQVPLRVLSRDGKLLGEFGAERRALLRFSELPPQLVNAFLAAEDDRFYEHSGVDYQGLLRAVFKLAATGAKAQGGSTITMQLARNVFLSSEKTFTRKFREILLAQNIERELSKNEILELYLNKIYLGERAYGVGAAALIYFNKPVGELSLAEMAVLAALPKAPSRDNPVANPERARDRRNYVLRRMRELAFITTEEFEAAMAAPITVHPYRARAEVDAYFVAEMVRSQLHAEYGEDVYARGLTVTTTLDSRHQESANAALRRALQDYDERHGWRGPEGRLDAETMQDAARLAAALDAIPRYGDLTVAAVLEAEAQRLSLVTARGPLTLEAEQFKWAGLGGKKTLTRGDLVRLRPVSAKGVQSWKLAQVPEAQAAFVSLHPRDGAILALSGGYDFWLSKFNHVTQARRQAGSGFKPFLYAAGLASGYTPASIFLDAPVVFDDPSLESSWRPENYDSDFSGPMRLREALVQSRNLVSIRLLQALGIGPARDYIARFGLPAERLPNDLTMALGSAVFTPLELAKAYATIANGGFAIEPYFIQDIRNGNGAVLFQAKPRIACPECEMSPGDTEGQAALAAAAPVADERRAPRVVEPQVIWMLTSMLYDVTVRGTAAALGQLGRNDLGGKTGTTNDETDAWFNGFQKNLVGIAWVGFDQPQPLGRGEVGGRAALPIWMDYMKTALKGEKQERLPRPPGLVDVRINPRTGKLASAGDASAVFETVPQERIPDADDGSDAGSESSGVEDLY